MYKGWMARERKKNHKWKISIVMSGRSQQGEDIWMM